MRNNPQVAARMLSVLGAAGIGATVAVASTASLAESRCTTWLVAGAYAFNFESQQGSPVFPPGAEGAPFATAGRLDLKHDGTWSAELETYLILDGQAPSAPIFDTAEGTWEVDANCLGRLDFAGGAEEDLDASFAVANHGDELFIVWAFIAEADAKRVFPRR